MKKNKDKIIKKYTTPNLFNIAALSHSYNNNQICDVNFSLNAIELLVCNHPEMFPFIGYCKIIDDLSCEVVGINLGYENTIIDFIKYINPILKIQTRFFENPIENNITVDYKDKKFILSKNRFINNKSITIYHKILNESIFEQEYSQFNKLEFDKLFNFVENIIPDRDIIIKYEFSLNDIKQLKQIENLPEVDIGTHKTFCLIFNDDAFINHVNMITNFKYKIHNYRNSTIVKYKQNVIYDNRYDTDFDFLIKHMQIYNNQYDFILLEYKKFAIKQL